MGGPLTIVMYHYVRNLENSRYPEIKGLSVADFEEQIQYVKKHYNVIGGDQLMASIVEGVPLPPRALMLTFDDGYIDHFTNVFPVLDREGLTGCFFPPSRCILENKVLDVNKIHFILASVPDKRLLVDYICGRIDEARVEYDLRSSSQYWDESAVANRFDPAEVVFCKRMLQRDLPSGLRQAITHELFSRYVSSDEASFSRELYMTPEQIRMISKYQMYVGSHGYEHRWLNTLPLHEQESEIDQSIEFMNYVGANTKRWIMCYPYGEYDDSLISVLKARNCVAGLTTAVGLATVDGSNALTLPRLDTNDLPRKADAAPAEWTMRAMGSLDTASL